MTTYHTTEAIVLGSYDIGESDRGIIFYTRAFGKIETIAKSIRLEKSKLKGHTILFAHVDIIFIGVRDGYRLISAELLKAPNDDIIASFPNMLAFRDFLLRLLKGTEHDELLWNFLNDVFIVRKLLPRDAVHLFSLKTETLHIFGMLPEEGIRTDNDIRTVLAANHML